MIKIKAFRTTQNQDSSELFADGHEQVLRDFGVEKVTSADRSWMKNPNVYVITVENEDGSKVYGGARIHVVGDENDKLPVQDAVGEMDRNIHTMVKADIPKGVGELCALWNAKEIRGSGVSTFLTKASVAKAGVKIANLLKINILWVLCAPYTVGMVEKAGFEIVRSLGNDGQFPYPKPDLPATVLRLSDTDDLSKASDKERKEIMSLRKDPKQELVEKGPKGELIVSYDLYIEDL